jgi:hypothetical protein
MRYLYQPYAKSPDELKDTSKRLARKVRWKAYWSGSVYVNPVNDLIGHFSDLTREFSLKKTLTNAKLMIEFTDQAIEVERPGDSLLIYPYDKISQLTFNYSPYGGYVDHQKNYLSFVFQGREIACHYMLNQRRLENICKFLLTQRIPFKEYLNGSRAHLGRQGHSYREIQELKKKYGLIW